jgi:CxxC motif-containing protein (DUF1111 family)
MYKLGLILFVVVNLTACGGGSSSADSVPVTPVTPVTPVIPVVPVTPEPEPTLDHSGLAPMLSDVIANSEYLSGGDTTVFVSNENAFSRKPAEIIADFRLDGNFTQGDHLFRTPDDGIGPLLSIGSCQGCHINDGRGEIPASPQTPMSTMVIKLADSYGNADPMYGKQIQPFSIQGFLGGNQLSDGFSEHDGSVSGTDLHGEAFPFLEFETINGNYPDGSSYQLRKPILKIRDLSYGNFIEDIRFSARLAPQAFGAGLLDAIPAEHLLALVDENDSNEDGISGRASMVNDIFATDPNQKMIGRFTYKAQSPSLLHQVAAAYNGDMGVSTSAFPREHCTDLQLACNLAAEQEERSGEIVDLTDISLAFVEFYNRVLGVPARRGFDDSTNTWDEGITAGRSLFFTANCVGCHTPRHVTIDAKGSVLGEISFNGLIANTEEQFADSIEVLSNQTIYPYTDLLLHDMGGSCEVTRETNDGVTCSSGAECFYVQRCQGLADGLIQGDASGVEWKTPALWGLGLVQTVNEDASFLHDGRARTIEEAVLWHGGEAENAKQAFMNFSQDERQQLLSFLKSL